MDPEVARKALLAVWDAIRNLLLFLCLWIYGSIRALLPYSMLPHKKIKDEVVLITGAGSGIGRLLSIEFAQKGARLVLWDINTEANEGTLKLVRQYGAEAKCFTCDISDRNQVYRSATDVINDIGPVDILINNAGMVVGKRYLECPDELIEKTMQVNTLAHFWTVKAFLPPMIERDHGHIVTIASAAGLVGCVGLADYCASKFAAVGFHESLCLEMDTMGKKGISGTLVCPFYINTGMFDGVTTKFPNILGIQDPDYVARTIVEAVATKQQILYVPRIIYVLAYLKNMLPLDAGYTLAHYCGATVSMNDFKGRVQNNNKID